MGTPLAVFSAADSSLNPPDSSLPAPDSSLFIPAMLAIRNNALTTNSTTSPFKMYR